MVILCTLQGKALITLLFLFTELLEEIESAPGILRWCLLGRHFLGRLARHLMASLGPSLTGQWCLFLHRELNRGILLQSWSGLDFNVRKLFAMLQCASIQLTV